MRKCSPSSAGVTHGADVSPLPAIAAAGADPRLVDVWCAFLGQLATDAEAAMAAAMAYGELDGAARDKWLAALEQDIGRIPVPRIAVYAPLLAVETDPVRRAVLVEAMGSEGGTAPSAEAYALTGEIDGNLRVAVLVAPLYLDFVRVIACAFRAGETFAWVKHDPIVERARALRAGDVLSGAKLESAPLRAVVDDLALTVVAQTRTGRPLPEALSSFADLFGPGSEPPPSRVATR